MSVAEKEVKEYVKRFPFNRMEFYEDRLVHRQRLMTSSEFSAALNNLLRRGELYEPRAGYIETTEYVKTLPKNPVKLKQINPIKKKPKILKSKVKLTKRRVIEGYVCRACGKWVKLSWAKRRPSKCKKCGKKMYYGKPVLKKQTTFKEKKTKFWKTLFEPVPGRVGGPLLISRVGKPRLSVARFAEPPPKPETVAAKPKKPKHIPRVQFRGSQRAHDAGLQAWRTRRKQGWRGKREILAFRKNKHGKTHPITARRSNQHKQTVSTRHHKLNVHPQKKNPKWVVAGKKAAATRKRNARKRARNRIH